MDWVIRHLDLTEPNGGNMVCFQELVLLPLGRKNKRFGQIRKQLPHVY